MCLCSTPSQPHPLLSYSLGAVDDDCRLTTPVGERLADFPVEPKLAKCLLESWDQGRVTRRVRVRVRFRVRVRVTVGLRVMPWLVLSLTDH